MLSKTPGKRNHSPSREDPPLSTKKARNNTPFTPNTTRRFGNLTLKTPRPDQGVITHLIQRVIGEKNRNNQKEIFKNYIKKDSSEHGWHLKATEGDENSLLYQVASYKPKLGEYNPLPVFLEIFWELLQDARNKKRSAYQMEYDGHCIDALKPSLLLLVQDDNKNIIAVLDSISENVKKNYRYYLMLSEMLTQAMAGQKNSVIPTLVRELAPLNLKKPMELILPYAKTETLPSFIAALTGISFEQQKQQLSKIKEGPSPIALLKISPAEMNGWKRHNALAKELIDAIPMGDIAITPEIYSNQSHQKKIEEINQNRKEAIQRLKQNTLDPELHLNLFKIYLEFIVLDLIAQSLLSIRSAYLTEKIGTEKNPTKIQKILEESKNRLSSIATIETVVSTAFQILFLGNPDNALISIARLLEHTERQKVDTEKDHNKPILSKLFTNSDLAEKIIPDVFKKEIIALCKQAGVNPKGELAVEENLLTPAAKQQHK